MATKPSKPGLRTALERRLASARPRARAAAAILAGALAAAFGGSAHAAGSRPARCAIRTSDGAFTGRCAFTRDKGGAFSVRPTGTATFFPHDRDVPGITDISVDVEGDRGDVRGLTTDGINSRWGSARRSAKDRACWIGDDFSVCVYQGLAGDPEPSRITPPLRRRG